MAKKDITAGSELITAELRWLATDAVNTPIRKSPADTLALKMAAIEVSAKLTFDENGPLHIFGQWNQRFLLFPTGEWWVMWGFL